MAVELDDDDSRHRLVQAARHVSQEARTLLTSLRGGPPHVARGELAQYLLDLRDEIIPASIEGRIPSFLIPSTSIRNEKPESYVDNRGNEPETETTENDDTMVADDTEGLSTAILERKLGESIIGPFLEVIVDSSAAGPHTLAALRAVYRLLKQGSLAIFRVDGAHIMQQVLACRFEQTDPGADEAVEMAMADVLLLIIQIEGDIPQDVVLEACNTVFVTRNTFVHSAALCYHFESVLRDMVRSIFSKKHKACRPVLEFLVNLLLHTPLVGGDGLDESTREAADAHHANRVLCLKLVRHAVTYLTADGSEIDKPLLHVIQDDLCLSLLMTGQAIWAYHDANSNISPGFVSLEVLTEICATLELLWNTCRMHLISQFETVFTGFYTRALVLLRKRKHPSDSVSFNANLIFDAEVEIILESLVDLLTLHDQGQTIATGKGGTLETIFAYYDCHMRRSDVAVDLIVELCRCCGGTCDPEGEMALTPANSTIFHPPKNDSNETPSTTPVEPDLVLTARTPVSSTVTWRPVPAHLRELCAQALMGAMKCLFRDDKASVETLLERSKRRRSILLRQVPTGLTDITTSGHILRDLKSKKRLMRKAASIFNKHASRGISFLLDSGLVAEPVSPRSVAIFLRSAIVVGLDKKAVGAYLGEVGKAPVAGKSPPNWERDWFHKEVLEIYCQLFRFEQQSLLEGLRMFLACFRLPGEAQQIDRILQAFADCCSQVCEESCNGRLKLFSEDPKRASDAAYLLSFSIIMLNTDQHNDNIREDRKMKCVDFVKNNTDYGRDITEKGKEFPREFLEGIYQSIREEEIRTEGEGADGAMTVERWKDVMRGSTLDPTDDDGFHPSTHDVEDLSELVLEHSWKPIISAIGGLWGANTIRPMDQSMDTRRKKDDVSRNGMLGVQGARLGMDMAYEMLRGIRRLGRVDIFCRFFNCICDYTGLVGDYSDDAVARLVTFSNSIESQAAVVVVFHEALQASEDLDEDCWRAVWIVVMELRDLMLISRGSEGIFHESDADLLSEGARRDWNMRLAKGDMEYDVDSVRQSNRTPVGGSVLGMFGRALWGTEDPLPNKPPKEPEPINRVKSSHGKEDAVIWDEGAPSDDEADVVSEESISTGYRSPGTQFEQHLIRENVALSNYMDMPITGLERVEETRRYQVSPRARVRERLRRHCSFESLVVDSRFMDDRSISAMLRSLVVLVADPCAQGHFEPRPSAPKLTERSGNLDRTLSDVSSSGSSFAAFSWQTPMSPASEAFAEVLLCEIALKNKDRLKQLWKSVLQDHYLGQLTTLLVNPAEGSESAKVPVDPGLEKRITGLLRLSIYAVKREDLADDVLSSWKFVLPINDDQHALSPLRALDKHIGEGIWRIVTQIDDLLKLGNDGWEGLVALMTWCAVRGWSLKPLRSRDRTTPNSLPEDDVTLQCYRALHLILNTKELEGLLPCSIADTLRALVSAGEKRKYPQLCIATLDLLGILHEKKIASIHERGPTDSQQFWISCWRKIVEGFADASEKSADSVSFTP